MLHDNECCYHMKDNSSHHFDVPKCAEEKDLGILFEDSLKLTNM